MPAPRYPTIAVRTTDITGQILPLVARCRRAMEQAGLPSHTIDQFIAKAATLDSYAKLHALAAIWFNLD